MKKISEDGFYIGDDFHPDFHEFDFYLLVITVTMGVIAPVGLALLLK